MPDNPNDEFEIKVCYPSLNPFYDDVEHKVLSPLFCIKEIGPEWVLEFDLPMVKKDDISVTLDDETTITVEAKLQEPYSEYQLNEKHEFNYFKKTISLPTKIDESQVSAKFQNGRLVIRIPKQRLGTKIKIE